MDRDIYSKDTKGLTTLFKERSDYEHILPSIAKVEKILKVFNAHGRLYYQMRKHESNVGR